MGNIVITPNKEVWLVDSEYLKRFKELVPMAESPETYDNYSPFTPEPGLAFGFPDATDEMSEIATYLGDIESGITILPF